MTNAYQRDRMFLISVNPNCFSQNRAADTEAVPEQPRRNEKLFIFKLFYDINITYMKHKQIMYTKAAFQIPVCEDMR